MSNKENSQPEDQDRRSPDRTAEDAGWEAKVLGRLSRRVTEVLDAAAGTEAPDLGWEQKSLELLRSRLKGTSE